MSYPTDPVAFQQEAKAAFVKLSAHITTVVIPRLKADETIASEAQLLHRIAVANRIWHVFNAPCLWERDEN